MNTPGGNIPDYLINEIDLLCLDAGNTIVFLDHLAVAQALRSSGFAVEVTALKHAEGAAKRMLEQGSLAMAPPLPDGDIHPGWGSFMRTAIQIAVNLSHDASAECVRTLWRAHREFNLWRSVPPGLIDALNALRNVGVPVCVVSNSEGKLQTLFDQLGIATAFDLVIDSHHVGVEKPDPAIFRHALSHFGIRPDRALHLGDVVAIDIVGARAAGMRSALIDPLGHYENCHHDVPRVPGAAEVAWALIAKRRKNSRNDA